MITAISNFFRARLGANGYPEFNNSIGVDSEGIFSFSKNFAKCGGAVCRLARDYERLLEALAGLHFLAFALLLLKQFFAVLAQSP